ncbi:ribonuclease E/G [Thalassospira mesophila]|uniref:Ribonuclease E n=1 Tax=Thalassospira mesophila TaxID=1293891 RepID=A0A1Y2KZT2_9PROT|nr:ribonuclease E/G [Thalassospira mesophila]OSQ38355.1 ribonuclease E [Thalassospira mesophila]
MPDQGDARDRLLLIDAVADERRVALIVNDRVRRIWLDRGGPRRFDIHIGRISRVLPEMAAAMVVLDGCADGLLPLDRIDGPLHEGQWVIVQVSRLGFDDKGPKLTGRIAIEGGGMIFRPGGKVIDIPRKVNDPARRAHLAGFLKSLAQQGESLTLRSTAADWADDVLKGEFSRLKSVWQQAVAAQKNADRPCLVFRALSDVDQVIERHIMAGSPCIVDGMAEYIRLRGLMRAQGADETALSVHKGNSLLFAHEGVETALDEALQVRVELPGGGWIAIEQTTALCAIDVNAGGAQALTGQNADRRNLDVNLAAAFEIVHQMILRNIGGLVVIDPIRMPGRAARDAFEAALRKGFGTEMDGAVQIGGFTRLGLYELTRQRSGLELASMMFDKGESWAQTGLLGREAAKNAVLRAIAGALRHQPVGQCRLHLHPVMAQMFDEQENCQRILTGLFGGLPQRVADATLRLDQYVIERA